MIPYSWFFEDLNSTNFADRLSPRIKNTELPPNTIQEENKIMKIRHLWNLSTSKKPTIRSILSNTAFTCPISDCTIKEYQSNVYNQILVIL